MTTVIGYIGYHSKFNKAEGLQEACGCFLLPLNTSKAGKPAPVTSEEDIIDEALYTFKANSLFTAYHVQGLTKDAAAKALYQLAKESFAAPGSPSFLLKGFFPAASNATETATWTAYFQQLRDEIAPKLLEKVYAFPEEGGLPNKFWMQFIKHSFMGLYFEKPPV